MPLKLVMETPDPLRAYVEAYRAQMNFAVLEQYATRYIDKENPELPGILDCLSPALFVGFAELLVGYGGLQVMSRGGGGSEFDGAR